MAFTNRYQKTIKGNLIQIGNTLGLSKANNTLTPGALGSIGAFITTQNLTAAGGWPANTTLSFAQNSSAAILTLPSGAVVDYAELIWSAAYVVPGSDVTASINNAISFTDPRGTTSSISATGVNITGISLTETDTSTNYVKSADVTNIIKAAGSGTYICGNVPAALSATSNFLSFAGWSLYVVYKLSSDPVRNIIIFVGQTVSNDSPYSVPVNYPGPPFPIRLFYTACEGDAIISGDQFNTRPATGEIVINLGTTVQPANSNPFASIIGDQSGGIDTTGSFGTRNPSGTSNTNIVAGRQGWDIANNINLLPAFTGGAVPNLGLDIGTPNDPVIMNANGFVVDLNQPISTLTKIVDKSQARPGDTLNYTLVYKFTTVPMSAANVIIVDTVPNGVTYQSGSVTVNGVSQPTFNPNPPGINLGSVNAVTTFTVLYKATVNNVIDSTTIPNDAFGSYAFVSNATPFVNENTSNSVLTVIDPFNASAVKFVDKNFEDLGGVISYTITIPNNGATLSNVIFKDTIPNGTSLVPNSFLINGITQSGVSPNPPGTTLPNINPGETVVVKFQVVVNTIPSPNPILNSATINSTYTFTTSNTSQSINTNIVSTRISNGNIVASKYADKKYGKVGDILTYKIVLQNTGNVASENVIFTDATPLNTTFNANSFTENSVVRTGLNPANSINLTSIPAGKVTTLTFSVTVTTLPNPNPIENNANAIYTFFFSPSQTGKSAQSFSNTVVTTINMASFENIKKFVSQDFANCGDIITYTIVMPNSGNVTAQNVIFKDTIPNGTALVLNSVFINGLQQTGSNPSTGVTIPNIAAGSTSTMTFSVVVQC